MGLGIITLAYPALAYFGVRHLPPGVIGLAIAAVALGRLAASGRRVAGAFGVAAGMAAAGTVCVIIADPLLGMKAYPVLVNASLAAVFGWSLWRPPTIIERLAKLREPDLPGQALPYIRNVTRVWLAFFLVNGSLATWTAIAGTIEQWAFYNGFLAYIAMGALFAGEALVRRRVRLRARCPL